MKTLSDNIKSIIALIVVILSYVYFFSERFLPGKSDPQILIAVVGTLGIAVGYYFGSSSSSTKKDEVIATALQTGTPINS